jgi:hypothetical protein
MRRHRQRCRRSVDRGTRRQSMEPRHRRFARVPTRSAHAEGHPVDAVLARRRRTRRGRRPLAGVDTRCAEPGRPCIWPAERSPGPHGAPTGHDRDGRVQGVGPLQSTAEAFAPRSPHGSGGAGGGKGAGQGERGGVHQEPATAPGSPVTGAQPRTAGTCGCLHVDPRQEARCGRAARRELCGGCRATGIPTATARPKQYFQNLRSGKMQQDTSPQEKA